MKPISNVTILLSNDDWKMKHSINTRIDEERMMDNIIENFY